MKKAFSVLLSLVLVFTLGGFGAAAQTSAGGTVQYESASAASLGDLVVGTSSTAYLMHGDINRLYSYYIPSGYSEGQQLPVMLLLHGSGLNAATQILWGTWAQLAQQEGFILVAPNSVGINQQGELTCLGTGAGGLGVTANEVRWAASAFDSTALRGVDDIDYLCKLLDVFGATGAVDEAQVFVAGHSNGGGMALRLALEVPERFAGVASVSSMIYEEHEALVTADKGLRYVFIQGTDDPVVPIEGMLIDLGEGNYWQFMNSLDYNVDMLCGIYGFDATPSVTPLPILPVDETRVVRYDYGTRGTASLVTYIIEGGGHPWPGAVYNQWLPGQYAPVELVGLVSLQAQASELIWEEMTSVRVEPPVITAPSTDIELQVGGAPVTLAVTVTPENTVPSLVWGSSDNGIVTVDQNGTLTAVSAGRAVVTVASAEDEAIKLDFNVTVLPAEVVPPDKTALESAIGDAGKLVESAYTAASWATLKTALAQAQAVKLSGSATKAEVEEATANLRAAMAGLVEMKRYAVEAADETPVYSGEGSIRFVIDANFERFQTLTLDGRTLVRGTDYAAEAGSTIITLQPALLQTLENGSYTLQFNFIDGTATASFAIQRDAAGGGTPTATGVATGDAANLALYIVLAIAALLAAGGMVILRVRKARKQG